MTGEIPIHVCGGKEAKRLAREYGRRVYQMRAADRYRAYGAKMVL